MSAPSRRPEIRRRRARKEKLGKLRTRYGKAAEADRATIFEKARLVSPKLTLDQFTKSATGES